MSRSYIAFISYRHKPLDMAVAKELRRSIERYIIPKDLCRGRSSRRLGYVFRDQDELPVSSDLSADIKTALDHSEYLIVICTPDAPQSPWVNQEIAYFLEKHPIERILAVLASGSPQESFPEGITKVTDENGNVLRYVEPLAANIASDSAHSALKKLRDEKLRIYAALIGCPYDTLRQRERRYKKARMLRICTMIAVIVLAFFGMLISKNHEISLQNEALEEQNVTLLRRESELMASTAAMQLEDDDYFGAIQNAVRSLPVDNDRPYVAKGAQVLADALGVYDIGNSVVTEILVQDTPISKAVFSADEKRAFTIDNVGRVTAFDIATGEQLWSVPVESDHEVYLPYLYYIPQNDSVLVKIGSAVCALSAEDGAILWSHLLNCSGDLYNDSYHASLSGSRTILAVDDISHYEPCITFISTLDGTVLGAVSLEDDPGELIEFQSGELAAAADLCGLGIFTDDESRFIGFCQNGSERRYYTVDLNTMAANVFHVSPIQSKYSAIVFGMSYDTEDDSLLVLERSADDEGITLKRISLTSGSVLLETTSDMDDNWLFIESESSIHTVFTKERIYLYYGRRLCAFDVPTGGRCGMFDFDSDIVHLSVSDSSDRFISVLTASGEHTLHGVGLSVISISDMLGSIHYGRTISQAYSLNGGHWDLIECDLNYGPDERGIYIEAEPHRSGLCAIVPVETPNQMLIERLNLPEEYAQTPLPLTAQPLPAVDYASLECAANIDLQIPQKNIRSACLFAEDRYLAVISDTDHLFIYDCGSGGLLFSEEYISLYTDPLGNRYPDAACIVYDSGHNRLFVYPEKGHGDGLLIDTASWVRLAMIPQLAGCYPDSSQILISKGGTDRYGSYTGKQSFILPIYDSEALRALGLAIIE